MVLKCRLVRHRIPSEIFSWRAMFHVSIPRVRTWSQQKHRRGRVPDWNHTRRLNMRLGGQHPTYNHGTKDVQHQALTATHEFPYFSKRQTKKIPHFIKFRRISKLYHQRSHRHEMGHVNFSSIFSFFFFPLILSHLHCKAFRSRVQTPIARELRVYHVD